MGEKLAFWASFACLCVALSLLTIMAVFVTVSPSSARAPDDILVADPVVLLQIGDEGECTGFVIPAFVAQSIATAGHCAAAAEGKTVTAKDSLGHTFQVSMVYVDKMHDLAIFAGAIKDPVASAQLACDAPVNIGDQVSIIGYPLDFGRVTTIGTVAAPPGPWRYWPEVYRLNIFAGPGNSGSPVFNKAGKVIAVLVGGNPDWPGMSMAVPISEFCHPKIV
jgi:S1-C subfamily serine protease